MISPFDTYVSSGVTQINRKKFKIITWLRDDMGISEIVEGILLSLFMNRLKLEPITWGEREFAIDFVLKYTKLKKLLSGVGNSHTSVEGTMDVIRKVQKDTQLLKLSQQFLNKIGYSYNNNISVQNNDVYINGRLPDVSFTLMETKLLRLLLEKHKKICSYFDIANVLWTNTDDFSIWAISRLIYKLRIKLNKNGISGDNLKTYKKKGFILDI